MIFIGFEVKGKPIRRRTQHGRRQPMSVFNLKIIVMVTLRAIGAYAFESSKRALQETHSNISCSFLMHRSEYQRELCSVYCFTQVC